MYLTCNYSLIKSGKLVIIIIGCMLFPFTIQSATGNWNSSVTGGSIVYTTSESATPQKDASGNNLTVVYLENLIMSKIGQNTNADDVNWLLSMGYRVIELDYANHTNTVTPKINDDIIAINKAINNGSFCGLSNCSKYRSWVLFEGYRIARDVPYFVDDPTVYNYSAAYETGDSLRMDIVYPANSSVPVPVVISFSYSNSYFGSANINQRFNLGNTLASFNDSFLEGAPANGIAWAIADHPKYCPWGNGKPVNPTDNKTYASYETNPDAAQKVKSAIRTLRTKGVGFGLSGKIGVYGFSRGSDAGSMAVGDRTVTEFENVGFNIGVSDDVQVAALGSGVFDFTKIYDVTDDGDSNLESKCPIAWGPLSSNFALWETMGSAYLAETSASAPVIFFYNTTDAAYYQSQIASFKSKLDLLLVPTETVINYGTGHAVPQTSVPLSKLYDFFKVYLTPPSVSTGFKNITMNTNENLQLVVSQNTAKDELNVIFRPQNDDKVQISLCNLSGTLLFNLEKRYDITGSVNESIQLRPLHLSKGIYFVKVANGNFKSTRKIIL
ncbi:MAG: T9SS type A sorting domain-containing protein [Paludibacter sp.]|nr:T9SS type A sorting domain-containing protein [Paludibacter sp.]